jgi:hypothetical protein
MQYDNAEATRLGYRFSFAVPDTRSQAKAAHLFVGDSQD